MPATPSARGRAAPAGPPPDPVAVPDAPPSRPTPFPTDRASRRARCPAHSPIEPAPGLCDQHEISCPHNRRGCGIRDRPRRRGGIPGAGAGGGRATTGRCPPPGRAPASTRYGGTRRRRIPPPGTGRAYGCGDGHGGGEPRSPAGPRPPHTDARGRSSASARDRPIGCRTLGSRGCEDRLRGRGGQSLIRAGRHPGGPLPPGAAPAADRPRTRRAAAAPARATARRRRSRDAARRGPVRPCHAP